jgi:MFS family permease
LSILYEIKKAGLLTRKGFAIISAGVLGGIMWILHFTLEFKVLEAVDLDYIYILFHLGSLPIGSLFFLLYSSKHNQKLNYLGSSTILIFSLISLLTVKEVILVIPLLIIAGFSNGNCIPSIFLLLSRFFKNPEYNGRIFYLAYVGVTVVLILETIINFIAIELINVLYLLILLITVVITFLIGTDDSSLPPREKDLRLYFRKRIIPYPVLLLSFFIGFFMTNVYYTAILIFNNTDLTDIMIRIPSTWNIFILVLFTTSFIVCIPCGYMYDKVGRRWSILIGFYLEAIAFIAFFIITLYPTLFPSNAEDIFLLVIFPVFAGIGFSLALYGALLVVLYELAPEGFSIIHGGVSTLAFGLGLAFGVITVTAFEPLIQVQPILLPVIMIFAYFTATIVVFHTEEPLPSKEELEWRKKVEHVLVINKIGLPIYSQPIQEQKLDATDAILAGGAIVGISTLINEITKASHLKVIKQENYCVILEEGSHIMLAVLATEELKAIRNRMLNFIDDFEFLFEDLLIDWDGVTKVFLPAKRLIEKHF